MCPKCHTEQERTCHHVWPRRFFHGSGPLLYLCRSCHNDIERLIPRYQRLSVERYEQIAADFLRPPRRKQRISSFAFRRRLWDYGYSFMPINSASPSGHISNLRGVLSHPSLPYPHPYNKGAILNLGVDVIENLEYYSQTKSTYTTQGSWAPNGEGTGIWTRIITLVGNPWSGHSLLNCCFIQLSYTLQPTLRCTSAFLYAKNRARGGALELTQDVNAQVFGSLGVSPKAPSLIRFDYGYHAAHSATNRANLYLKYIILTEIYTTHISIAGV